MTDLPIKTEDAGFYDGFSKFVALPSKIIISTLIIWACAFPENSGEILKGINKFILSNFGAWYIWVVTFYVIVCLALALWPTSGRLNLGKPGEKPEFSNFSWFSMMFGAGIGVGMLTWAVAEPMIHFYNNPEVIQGLAEGGTEGNVRNAYKWSFLHWGLGAWACYALVGLALAFFAYRRDLPLTMRSGLTPLFGKSLSGGLGNVVDIVAVVATILGVAQALGFGVEQFTLGLHRIGVGDWLLQTNEAGKQSPSTIAIIFSLVIIMGASTLSALSGVGKGIKWLSNINMVLSIALLLFLLVFGATWFGLSALFFGIIDYLVALPHLLFAVFSPDDAIPGAEKVAQWQGDWSVFYWAWWIAFAPFVGLFLARISKGRSIREFILGAMILPSIVCFIWFSIAGGTAINLELTGEAGGVIKEALNGDKLYAVMAVLLQPTIALIATGLILVLLLTYLVTSADSAVLIINTINAAGDESPKGRVHIIFWGVSLGLVVGSLLIVGGYSAIVTAMVIGAFPFSVVMALMCISLIKAIYRDSLREKEEAQIEAPAK
jgi:choline/carnitine/betaine transport